ncbi:hypothetical protein R6Q59_016750 [Mikania micrantha]
MYHFLVLYWFNFGSSFRSTDFFPTFRFGRMADEEQVKREDSTKGMLDLELDKVKAERKNKRKKQLMKEAAKADKRGVCYLSRVPPRMDPRQLLSQYGEIERIWLTHEGFAL